MPGSRRRALHAGLRRRTLHAFLTSARHELNPFGNHLMLAAFLAVLAFPAAPLQASLNERRSAFTQKLAGRFSLATEDNDIHKADVFPALIALPRASVRRHTKGRHRGTVGRIAQFRIAREIAEQDDFVEACHTPGLLPECLCDRYSLSSSIASSSAILPEELKRRPSPSSMGPRRP